jgi:hypothetical protein
LAVVDSTFSYSASAPAAAYNIQPKVISISATSVFSLPASTTISDLTISKFIS